MERVLDRLWIGSTEDFRAPLGVLGFVGVLDLRDGMAEGVWPGVFTHRVDQRDGDPWCPKQVIDALDFVVTHIQRGKVLIACAAGMSRSACMTIGYLMRMGFSVAEAFELVRAARPIIQPVPKMLESVLAVLPKGAL